MKNRRGGSWKGWDGEGLALGVEGKGEEDEGLGVSGVRGLDLPARLGSRLDRKVQVGRSCTEF